MKKEARYPDLKYLMELFHQDWMEIYSSDTDLLRDFAKQESSALVQRVVADIRRLVEDNSSPQKVDTMFVKEWYSERPYKKPTDAFSWLNHATKELQSASRQSGSAKVITTIRPNIEKFPGLYLLMCQFDSDWEKVFKSETNLFRQFKRLHAREDLEACVGDILRVLDAGYSDADLNQMLKEEFGGFPPFTRKEEARLWLKRVVAFYHNIKPGRWVEH